MIFGFYDSDSIYELIETMTAGLFLSIRLS